MATNSGPDDRPPPGQTNDLSTGEEPAKGAATPARRALAFENIRQAAQFFGVDMQETDWRQLGRRPRAERTPEQRRESARKAADTRKKNARRPPKEP